MREVADGLLHSQLAIEGVNVLQAFGRVLVTLGLFLKRAWLRKVRLNLIQAPLAEGSPNLL